MHLDEEDHERRDFKFSNQQMGEFMGMKPPSPVDVRKEIAKRLKQEITRKGLTAEWVARTATLPIDIVNGYLSGAREISFAELRPLCDAVSMRLMRLLAPKFGEPRLQYRGAADLKGASEIENTFLTVADLLPKPKPIPVAGISHRDGEIGMLLTETRAAVNELRSKYPTVEALYEATRLPILPVMASGAAFDAFLMTMGDRSVVCVNTARPPVRVHFSLLHEMAHFLWHRDCGLPVDTMPADFFQDSISEETRPEYVANKFAQFYMVPWEDAEQKARQWRQRQLPDQAQYLAEQRASAEVLACGIHDYLRFSPPSPPYTEVRDTIKQATTTYSSGDSLKAFLERAGGELRAHIVRHRDDFSDEVWNQIASAWEIHHDG